MNNLPFSRTHSFRRETVRFVGVKNPACTAETKPTDVIRKKSEALRRLDGYFIYFID